MKKLLALLLCAMILLPGCAHVPDNTAPAPTPAATVPPTVTPAVTAAAPKTPSASPVPVADLTEKVLLPQEDQDILRSLWPLKTRAMTDFGRLTALSAITSGSSCLLTVRLVSQASFDELKASLPEYIVGRWSIGDTEAFSLDSLAEGDVELTCDLTDAGDRRNIDIMFYLDSGGDEVAALVDRHWPADALQWPDGLLSGEVVHYTAYFDADEHVVSRVWYSEEAHDLFVWFDNRYARADGYERYGAEKEYSENIVFTAAGLDVKISCNDASVSVKFYATPSEETVTEGDYTAVVLYDGTLNIVDYTGSDSDIVIPAALNGIAVTSVSGGFFGKPIRSVTVPEGVLSLGDGVFAYCLQLDSVSLPDTLQTIGSLAFAGDVALTSISIPAGVTDIGESAFFGCTSLENVAIP
jgi:hypothetical protein